MTAENEFHVIREPIFAVVLCDDYLVGPILGGNSSWNVYYTYIKWM